MQQLRKIGAVGGAIVLVLCWPLAVGQIGQTVITDGIQELNSDSLQAKIVNYDRGYLSSDVTTQYKVVDEHLKQQLEIDGLPTTFVVNSHVKHGLVSLTALSTLADKNPIPLKLTTVTQLNGNTDFDFDLASWNFTSKAEDGMTFSISPSSLKGSATVLGHVDYQLDMPSVQLNFNNGDKVELNKVSAKGDGQLEQGYWLGQQSMNVANLTVNDAQGHALFDLQQSTYKVSTNNDAKQNSISSHMQFDAASLMTTDGVVKNVNFDFSVNDLDKPAFERLFNQYQNNAELQTKGISALLPDIDALFDKGFNISLNNLSLKVGEGDFKTQLHLAIPTGTAKVSQDPSMIISALTGNFDTFFSKQLVLDYPFIKQGVDEMMVMEMMKQKETGYEMKGTLEKGNIVFDGGHKVPMLSLLMPLLLQH